MGSLSTDAIVLHSSNYLESSRILRLITREAGVQSVLARGARTSRRRFGSALDLFAEGVAELQVKPGRELHTLVSFEVRTSRSAIGTDLVRFTAAAAFCEAVLRVVHDEAASRVYDSVAETLGRITTAPIDVVTSDTIGGLWRLVAEVGVAPALTNCALCHKPVDANDDVTFDHDAGGALCASCASLARSGRRLPAEARTTINRWLSGEVVPLATPGTARSHQRLLREFLVHHAADSRPLRAYAIWESGEWEPGTEHAPSEL